VILLREQLGTLSTIQEIQLHLFELDVKGSFACEEDEIRTVLGLVEQGSFPPWGMLNKKVRLEEA
jgi:hypothetical protein